MKRFYCTICKRARRVRKYPVNVFNTTSENVADRTGTCAWHDAPAIASLRMQTGVKTRSQFVSANVVKAGK